jgi:hypothetical protein
MSTNDKVSEAFVLREIAECEALAEGQKEFLRRLAAQCLVPSAERASNATIADQHAASAATEKAGSTPAQSQRSGETGGRFDSGVVDSGEPKARPASGVSLSAESGERSISAFPSSDLPQLLGSLIEAVTDACDSTNSGDQMQAAMRKADGIRLDIERRFALSATSPSNWVEHTDIPNIKGAYIHHPDLGKPIVTRTNDGRWWSHPGLPHPTKGEAK